MSTVPLKINPTAWVGFMVGVGAWSIMFVMLILGYVFYRVPSGPWLAGFVDAPVIFKAMVNTGLLLVSSWMLHQFFRTRKIELFQLGLLSGLMFLFAQWKLWVLLLRGGLTWTGSMAGSFLYLLTGFHALHVLAGLVILLPLGLKFYRNAADERNIGRFFFALRFWDLLFVFWLGLFVLIFIFK